MRILRGAGAAMLSLAAAAAMALAACGGDDSADPTPTPGSTETPAAASPTAATPGASPTPAATAPAATPTPVVLTPTFTCTNPIAPLQARLNRGQQVELQGRVFGVMDRNGDAVLAVGAPLDALLRVEVVVPSGSRQNFPADPLVGFAGRDVCVRGTVEEIGGVLTIAATSPGELTVVQ
ncbi:MAG: hypothetical protein K6U79_07330 [Firmicutes bacterium]|nr:hypothetical protein [Bacillota bacterium]